MRAAVLREAPGRVTVEDLMIDDRVEPDEVRVRVAACGLCHSDLHMLDGTLATALPTVPGHEVSGVVEAIGSKVSDVAVGDHVVACLSMFCGRCRECARGRTWLCERNVGLGRIERPRPRLRSSGEAIGQVAGLGGLAEFMIVHRNAVVGVPKEVPLTQAALLGCAVMTGVGSAFNGARVSPGSTVAVIGCGGVGLNVVQGAAMAGARRIVAVDMHRSTLDIAKEFGATDTVDGSSEDVVAAVRELADGGVDYAFDVVGVSDTVVQAVEMVRKGATAFLVGIAPAGTTLNLPGAYLLTQAKGLQALLMGSNRFKRDIPMLADLYLRGRLKLDELVSEVLTPDRVNEGFDHMRCGGAARAVVRFD